MGYLTGVLCALIAAAFLVEFYIRSCSERRKFGIATATTMSQGISGTVDSQIDQDVNGDQAGATDRPNIEVNGSVQHPHQKMEVIQIISRGPSERAKEPGLNTQDLIEGKNMPPPSFPLLPRLLASDTSMPPPPSIVRAKSPPRLNPPSFGRAPRPGGSSIRPPPSAAASLRVPQQQVLQNANMIPTSSTLPATQRSSRQVTLEPGHSAMDWASLTRNPQADLRGPDAPSDYRVTFAQLKAHNGRKGADAWTVYQGRVYNITPYLPFHPGGKGELLRGAAKDSAKLFLEIHPWVNWEGILGECLVGRLVGDEETQQGNKLDDMD